MTTAAPTLWVFTPTYNRAYILPALYESLLAQTSTDFQWIIVDDGSTDDTESLVQGWIAEGRISIDYVKQENGGKPRATNTGVARCRSELFFVVDSDDHLVPTAVEHVLTRWEEIRGDDSFAGIVALRGTDEHTPMGTWMPDGVRAVTLWDLHEKMGFRGDTSLIHRTEILRRYPFEVAPGEKFVAESSVWFLIDESYNMLADNEILTICHYLPDGLTQNFASNAKRNPIGYWKHKRYCAARSTTLKSRARETSLFLVGCMLAHQKGAISMAPSKALAVVCYPVALLARYTMFR